MNKYGRFSNPLMWFLALLLTAFLAGCGGGDDGAAAPSAAGAVCSGAPADCVDLATAGDFVILAQTAISETGTSAVNGIVGLESGTGITGLTCAEVTGSIIDEDAGYSGGGGGSTSCLTTTLGRITDAVAARVAASGDASTRTADATNPTAGTLNTADSAGAVPGVYHWTTGLAIQSDFTLTGNSTDVWIFQVDGTLSQAANTNVILVGALPQNVFWQVDTNVTIGADAHLEGIILAGTTIVLGNGTSVDGRLLSGTAVTLDTNAVVRP